jgi:hypothetical protein
MSTRANRTGKIMADALKEMIENEPNKQAFTLTEIAQHISGRRKPNAQALQWVLEELPKARRRLEDLEGMAFIPVTTFYFEHYYGRRPPRSDNGAIKCVAGIGFGGSRKTVGIRKLWIGYQNDGMAFLWLRQGHKSGGGRWKHTTDRVLDGFAKKQLTKKFAKEMLEDGFVVTLPDDRKTFSQLLPQAMQQKLITS